MNEFNMRNGRTFLLHLGTRYFAVRTLLIVALVCSSISVFLSAFLIYGTIAVSNELGFDICIFHVRMRRHLLTLENIDILSLVYSNFCSDKSMAKVC